MVPSAPVSEQAPPPNDKLPSPRETRRYCHVIWDWNGTLLDDVNYSVDLMNALLDRHGLPTIDLDRYRAIFDFPIRVYYERAGFDLSRDGTFEHLGREWMDACEVGRFTCPLQGGARDILEAIQSANITQSILSAYPRDSLQTMVGYFRLTKYFVRLLGLHCNGKCPLFLCKCASPNPPNRLHTVEAAGSNPATPTAKPRKSWALFFSACRRIARRADFGCAYAGRCAGRGSPTFISLPFSAPFLASPRVPKLDRAPST